MISRIIPALFFLFFSFYCYGQDEDLLKASTIPLELKVNANAVVRYDNIDIDVKAFNKMIYTNKRAITIFNSSGDSKHGAVMGYSKNISIKKMEAKIYNANGDEIKKIRKNDFQDVSAVDGGTLYSDDRVKYLDYTPINYPYTVTFEIEVEYHTTAFLPGWRPIEGFYTSTQNAYYKITNESDVEVKLKTTNFEEYGLKKESDLFYSAKNLIAIKPEAYSPSFRTYAPYLRAALTEFDMEGIKGQNNNWKDFGKWMHDNLILGTQELPGSVKGEVRQITSDAKTDKEKAKIIYEYMQNKTRYISVQVGIGGWKPMDASDVDRLGYGDCKGLTNYTKAMMDEVGVQTYYTVIYGGKDIRNIDKEFSATEGNHVILCLPDGNDYVWLECTSQTVPFGYNANFTDDRDALIVTPEGGKIVHTKAYKTEDNLQYTKAQVSVNQEGDIAGNVVIESTGYQYNFHQGIETKSLKTQNLHYKEYWSYINNLIIEDISLDNDKEAIKYTEEVKILAKDYASKSGARLLLQPNMFNKVTRIPTRYSDRKQDFEIDRGFTDTDEFIIEIAPELSIEALPDPVSIKTKFGSYSMSIKKITDSQLIYTRSHILNKGYFNKTDYADFRKFKRNVVKHDKAKIVLITKT